MSAITTLAGSALNVDADTTILSEKVCVTSENRETSLVGLDELTLGELLNGADAYLSALSARLAAPRARNDLAQFAPETQGADWGGTWAISADTTITEPADANGGERETKSAETPQNWEADRPEDALPALFRRTSTITSLITGIRMTLAGFVDEVYLEDASRAQRLGIPEGKAGFRNSAEYLRHLGSGTLSDAKTLLKLRPWLASGAPTLTGYQPAPIFPHASTALVMGQLGDKHAQIFSRVAESIIAMVTQAKLPAEIRDETLARADEELSPEAAQYDADGFARIADRWLVRTQHELDPDGAEPSFKDHQKFRGAFYMGVRNGLHEYKVRVNTMEHEGLQTITSAANNPRSPQNRDAEETDSQHTQDAEGTPIAHLDERSHAARSLDGMMGVIQAGLRTTANGLPSQGGRRPQMMVTIDYTTLLGQAQRAGLLPNNFDDDWFKLHQADPDKAEQFLVEGVYTGPLAPANLRRLLCDAQITPVVLGKQGRVLDIGREDRYFTSAQTKALVARDGGCTAPGCSAPAPWCEAHHIKHWEHGGDTSVENATLLCSHHHHAVHAGVWTIRMNGGVPWYTPATWLDPDQIPRRNTYWRPFTQ